MGETFPYRKIAHKCVMKQIFTSNTIHMVENEYWLPIALSRIQCPHTFCSQNLGPWMLTVHIHAYSCLDSLWGNLQVYTVWVCDRDLESINTNTTLSQSVGTICYPSKMFCMFVDGKGLTSATTSHPFHRYWSCMDKDIHATTFSIAKCEYQIHIHRILDIQNIYFNYNVLPHNSSTSN
jgi:hypothetical protein